MIVMARSAGAADIKPERLAGYTAYGSGANVNWLVNEVKNAPHIPKHIRQSRRRADLPNPSPDCAARQIRREPNRAFPRS